MGSRPLSKKKIALLMLLEEEEEIEDEIYFIVGRLYKVRKSVSSMYTSREQEGVFKLLIHRHLLDDEVKFKSYFRVTRCQFEYLLSLVENDLAIESCNRITIPISAAEKLALTLRFLATGESYRSLAFSYRISSAYISTFVPKVLKALKNRLLPLNMPPPEEIDWEQKESEFWKRWDFPNVVAALDGKHVRIVAPNNTGSLFFNLKKYFSIVLLALVDANCKFLIVDIGSYGKEGDAGIFKKSDLGRMIENGTIIFPPPKYSTNSNILLPYVVVGDEALRLDKHMMKPYCKKQAMAEKRKRHFNYHLCKVRRVTENAFGILCSVFRIFFTPINVKPETVDLVIVVCCCLHNFLRDAFMERNPNHGEILDSVHDFPVENMIPLAGCGGFAKAEGFKVRERLS